MPLNRKFTVAQSRCNLVCLESVCNPKRRQTMTSTLIHTDQASRPARHRLSVGIAQNPREILQAQKLRYRVFCRRTRCQAAEPHAGRRPGHLRCLLRTPRRTRRSLGRGGRHLPHPVAGEGAQDRQLLFGKTNFDLTRLQHLRPRMVEIGRSCVDEKLPHRRDDHAVVGGTGQVHDRESLRVLHRLRQHQHGRRRPRRGQPLRPARRVHESARIPRFPRAVPCRSTRSRTSCRPSCRR